VGEETLDYILREMTHASGGFFSAQDADSEGVEGKFFVWSAEEIAAALDDPEMTRAALAYWGVDRGPNFEGHSILFVPREPSEVAEDLGLSEARLEELVDAARARLYGVRDKRVHPGLDDKVLASWNGLALAAFAEAGRVLGRADYIAAAVRNAAFIVTQMKAGERLLRSWKDGQAKIKGYLEDYAMVGVGLLALYEATFDRRWLDESRRLAEQALVLFWEEGEGIFFDTGIDPRGAGGEAAQPLRQCGPIRHLGGHRVAAEARRVLRRGALRGGGGQGAPPHGRSHDPLSLGLRALPLGPGFPPRARGRGRSGLA
jgi:Highly conserved protein containing a thioredoxin domain